MKLRNLLEAVYDFLFSFIMSFLVLREVLGYTSRILPILLGFIYLGYQIYSKSKKQDLLEIIKKENSRITKFLLMPPTWTLVLGILWYLFLYMILFGWK